MINVLSETSRNRHWWKETIPEKTSFYFDSLFVQCFIEEQFLVSIKCERLFVGTLFFRSNIIGKLESHYNDNSLLSRDRDKTSSCYFHQKTDIC